MKRAELVALRLGLLLVVAGCWSEYQVGSLQKPAAKPAASPAAQASQPATPAMPPLASSPAPVPSNSPAPSSPMPSLPKVPPATGPGSTGPAAQQPSIHLSAGVALPQTGPEGTMMCFSIDYQVLQGDPHPSTQYFWVIERAQGQPAKIPARLEPKGTLQVIFTQGWRPEEGPFQTHIEDAYGRKLADTTPLKGY